ncbi:MAG TPA: endonuclease NucS domain-containing protein [Blastocatellia bacterium]|nr:endonuclease NucS domain-containing protein [Blastocatellia bacterium]
MGTEIKTWQIVGGLLTPLQSALKSEGRTEPYDLEPWIASQPDIVASDLLIVGRQAVTRSGPIDLLGIDSSGNTVIIELKRDELPRESLAQAIDYASDVAGWTVERLNEVCLAYMHKPLETAFNEAFPDVDVESLNINSSQRIVLVGFSIEASLERMIEWLSETYGVNINAIVLSYIKTKSGDELLTRTAIISEEIEQERSRKQKKFEIPMSDSPGTHDVERLKSLLHGYLSREKVTNQRMRDILFPSLLQSNVLTRAELKRAFVAFDPQYDESKIGYYLTLVSSQLGMKKNDFLRQVVKYEYPRHHWEKDNFAIRNEYRALVKEVLEELRGS